MSTPVKAFIIHLARAEARRPQVDRILAACPVPAFLIDAVDGRALSSSQIDAVYTRKSLHAPRYPFKLTVGEIGCFLSHRKAWQAILDSGVEAGLVIEDDVEIETEVLARGLDLASEHIGKLGYIQFQTRQVPKPARVIVRRDGIALVCPVVGPLRTSAQLVSAVHARHLLKITERFDRPVDGVLQMGWVTSKALCCVEPSGVTDRTLETGGSTISQKRGKLRKIAREIQRFVYRRRIYARSVGFQRRSGDRA